MELTINGEAKSVDESATLDYVLAEVGVTQERAGVAVAVNDSVIPKSQWADRRLSPGDRVEVIRAVQGG